MHDNSNPSPCLHCTKPIAHKTWIDEKTGKAKNCHEKCKDYKKYTLKQEEILQHRFLESDSYSCSWGRRSSRKKR